MCVGWASWKNKARWSKLLRAVSNKIGSKTEFLSSKDFYSSQPIPIGVPSDEKDSPILANNSSAFSYSAS